MDSRDSFIRDKLEELSSAGLYRQLKYGSVNGQLIKIKDRDLVNLGTNDYLGMPSTEITSTQLQSSSRLISGNDDLYYTLEKKLARLKSKQASLVYPTGYMANIGVISALAERGDLIVSDELNHSSIIDACKISDANVAVYAHNNMTDLESKLKRRGRHKFVISEGIFSMDGDYANLPDLVGIAKRAGAITILDDAHGDFVIGRDGKGTMHKFGVVRDIDVYTSSLSKGLGSFGGYIAATRDIIDLCINRSRSFIYTSALPRSLIQHALLRLNIDHTKYRRKLYKNTKRLKRGLLLAGYDIRSNTHIMPIIVGDEHKVVNLSRWLYKQGLFVQPIRYPTVPYGTARLRISVTSWLDDATIDRIISIFTKMRSMF